ncbi:MAG: SRPBCC family protein [Bacteroidota bacterium]
MKSLIKTTLLFAILVSSFYHLQAQKRVQNFTVTNIINAPADQVWAVVGEDYGAIANSHPKIISSDYINGSLAAGEGAERVCNFNESGTRYLHEKQVDYDPENYTFRNQVFQAGKFPVDPAYTFAIYRVEPIDANTSRLVFDMTYRTKPAFMGGMMKGQFRKLINDYALAIEHHVNTGETVNKENFRDIKRQYEGR